MLGEDVEKVIVGSRLADPRCVVTVLECCWSSSMERVAKAQALRDGSMTSNMALPDFRVRGAQVLFG